MKETSNMRPLILANWKMHGDRRILSELAEIEAGMPADLEAEVVICPPAPLLYLAAERASRVVIGGQDCHHEQWGAFTGCVSAPMIKDAGGVYVVVGHSERRRDFGEADVQVRAKADAALSAGLTPIVCVGEGQRERDAGAALSFVEAQLRQSLPTGYEVGMGSQILVAYEPGWAVGTGRTPSLDDIRIMHGHIREFVGPKARILYGGSVKGDNAPVILALADVNGVLIGGASLSAKDFLPIILAA